MLDPDGNRRRSVLRGHRGPGGTLGTVVPGAPWGVTRPGALCSARPARGTVSRREPGRPARRCGGGEVSWMFWAAGGALFLRRGLSSARTWVMRATWVARAAAAGRATLGSSGVLGQFSEPAG